jgi:hypothetical protein
VAALKELVVAKLKLEAPPNRVTLTKEGEDTPLDSTLTVQKALGGVARPRLIVKAPKVEHAPGAWHAVTTCQRAQIHALAARFALDFARSPVRQAMVRSVRRGCVARRGHPRHGPGEGAA